MAKPKNSKLYSAVVGLIIAIVLIDFVLLIRHFLQGKNIALLNPQGLIAQQQLKLMLFSAALLLCIALPTLFVLYFTAWKYRESNQKEPHKPQARTSKALVASMWLVPTVFMLALAAVMWPATHKLHPKKAIAADAKNMTIQVVSMNWKWLFLYPQQNIATVNYVQLPVDTPVTFEMTADEAPMSSFWIPNLSGQLYTMTSHVNRLNVLATNPGDYPGSSAEINGSGFSGMKFVARVSSVSEFEHWVGGVKQSAGYLDTAKYDDLVKPSQNEPVALYGSYDERLFDRILTKYRGPDGEHAH